MLILVTILVFGEFTRAYEFERDNFVVTIDRNSLKSIQPTPGSSDRLDLSGLRLQNIVEDSFQTNSKIKNLSLANNHLSNLPVLTFRALVNLEYLSLANNSLKKFQYAFGGCALLRTLDIRNNNIKRLREGSFHGLLIYTKILTDGNDFGGVKPRHFEKPFPLLELCMIDGIVHFLEAITLESREQLMEGVNCKKKFRPLLHDFISLGLEGIKGFKKGWYRLNEVNATFLDIQLNEINEITSELLNDLPESLTRINLAWNRIGSLKAGVINNKKLREFDLRGNPISVIEDNALANTSLTKFVLSGKFIKNLLFADTLPSTLSLFRLVH